jgi:transposase
MRQHCVRDDQWDRIKDTLPGRTGAVGVTAVDNRRFVDAVLYRPCTLVWPFHQAAPDGTLGQPCPWRDLPETLGDWNNTHRRLSCWATRGVWEKLLTSLAADADNDYAMIDATIMRAHQHGAGSWMLASLSQIGGIWRDENTKAEYRCSPTG